MSARSVFLIFLATVSQTASACQYTVRDVGFVDLSERAYTLYILPDSTTRPIWEGFAPKTGKAFLSDTNLRMEVLSEEAWKNHADLKPLADRIDALPRSVLVSEEGRALLLDNPIHEGSPGSEILAYLEGILDSPLRKEIARLLIRSHCITLLVDGADGKANAEFAREVDRIHDNLAKNLDRLPKAAKEGPKLLRVGRDSLEQERILLWSLGIDETDRATPSVAILFGRGRAIGGAMTGEAITVEEIERRVGLIGESCECELDRSWMQGESIPMRWGAEMQTEVARTLGFDAENPMVKMEISQILDKGAGTGPAVESFAYSQDPLFGYGEMEVFDFGSTVAGGEPAEAEVRVTQLPPVEPLPVAEPAPMTVLSASEPSPSVPAEGPLPTQPTTDEPLGEESEFQAPKRGNLGLVAAALFFLGVLTVGLAMLLLPRSGKRLQSR